MTVHPIANREPSLDDLNDDVLLEIMATLKNSSTVIERRQRAHANAQNKKQMHFPEVDEAEHDVESPPPVFSRPRPLRRILRLFPNRTRSSAARMANHQISSNEKEQPSVGLSPDSLQETKCDIVSPRPAIRPPRVFGPLQTLSMANKRFRQLAAPKLYKSITTGPGVNWNNALAKLDTISTCEAVKVHAKSFLMDIYTGPTPEESLKRIWNYREPEPPQRMTDVLFQNLSKMMNLHKLTLLIPGHHTKVFQRSFETSKINFTNIRTLVLGPHLDWMIAKCPNVEVISTSDYRWMRSYVDGKHYDQRSTDLIRAAGQAKYLQHFEMHDEWSNPRLNQVCQTMPSIRILAMPSASQHYHIESLLPILGQFRNLKILVLEDAQFLKVGFEPSWCGNVYMGPGAQRAREFARRQGIDANTRVANMVFATVLTLEILWVGDVSRATVTRTHFGNEITWAKIPRLKPYRDHWHR